MFDALRGVAAVEVMLFHITNIDKRPMLAGGYLAVDLFFLLSGYVLWNAYGPRLAGGGSTWRFVRVRFVRLYPLFAIGLALGVARAVGGMHLGDPRAPTLTVLLAEIVTGALLIPSGFDANAVFPLDNPAWSLSLEVMVNIAFCLWMVRLSNRSLVRLGLVGAIAVAATVVHFGSLDTGWRAANYAGGPARCLFSFTLGILMARTPIRMHLPRWTARFVPAALLALFTGLLAFDAGATLRPAFDLTCVLVAFPAIVAVASCVALRGRAARIGSAIGELSYPLYATHYPLILPLGIVCARLHIDGTARIVVVALVCVIAAAVLVPVDRAIRARFGGPRATAPASGIVARGVQNALRWVSTRTVVTRMRRSRQIVQPRI